MFTRACKVCKAMDFLLHITKGNIQTKKNIKLLIIQNYLVSLELTVIAIKLKY